jgi:predicted dehydrogenase
MPDQVSCHLRVFEPDGRLDDYGTALLRFPGGALASITASRISHGRENDLWIEIDGTKAALEWHQEEPNRLLVRANGQPHRLYTRDPGAGYLGDVATVSCRLPAGHPEAFLEAFANVYTAAYLDMIARAAGQKVDRDQRLYPDVDDGVDGMRFVTRCVASSRENGTWLPFAQPSATS